MRSEIPLSMIFVFDGRGIGYEAPRNHFPSAYMDITSSRGQKNPNRTTKTVPATGYWERRFIGEIKAGRDPPNWPQKINTEIRNVSELLDAYRERCVKPAGLRSAATVRSQIGVLKTHLGTLSLS